LHPFNIQSSSALTVAPTFVFSMPGTAESGRVDAASRDTTHITNFLAQNGISPLQMGGSSAKDRKVAAVSHF
jgi:hypothetical protein